MKAKFNITLPEVQAGDTKVMAGGHIETEVEFAPSEMKDMYQLRKEMLNELPAILKSFAIEVCKVVVEAKAACTEELMKDEDFKAMREADKKFKDSIDNLAKKAAEEEVAVSE